MPYTTQVLRMMAAQICQTIGWQAVTPSSLELLVDILDRYLKEICKTTHDYAELYNRTEANLDDLGLTFRDMGINISDIEEYIQYVDPVMPAIDVPKYPVHKDSHLNFLKPGSKEVLTRPVHIHEHLPPINPPEDEPLYSSLNGDKEIDVVGVADDAKGTVFKRPADGGLDSNSSKKPKIEEEGRPTREISSVMMTTSGFISPAREGKLPESRPPVLIPEFKPPPPALPTFSSKQQNPNPVSVAQPASNTDKKMEKKLKKKNHEKEKKKEKPSKEKAFAIKLESEQVLFSNPISLLPPIPQLVPPHNEHVILTERKKLPKEPKKTKIKNKHPDNLFMPVPKPKKEKNMLGKIPKIPKNAPFDIAMALPKYDKFPIPPAMPSNQQVQAHSFLTAAHSFMSPMMDQNVFAPHPPLIEGKLISEPDKNKLNIFKKISKKDDPSKNQSAPLDFLTPNKYDRYDTDPSGSQGLFMDAMSSNSKKHKTSKSNNESLLKQEDMPINFSMSKPQDSHFSMDELAIPKTPNAPRTPEMKFNQNGEKKKKRKDKEKKSRNSASGGGSGGGSGNLNVGNDWQNPMNPMQSFFNAAADPMNAANSNPFMPKIHDGLMGSFNLQNMMFPYANPGLIPSGPGLIPGGGNLYNSFNPFPNMPPGMDISLIPKQEKVKAPKVSHYDKPPKQENFMNQPEKSYGGASLVSPSFGNDKYSPGYDTKFDAMKNNKKQETFSRSQTETVQTYDLTSSPEPVMPPQNVNPVPIAQVPVMPMPPTIEDPSMLKTKEKKKDKEHKKEKRDKEGKIKKKKDKKDKVKNKDGKEKSKKDRDGKEKSKKEKKEKRKEKNVNTCDNNSTSSVPKLMLKLNSPRPNTPDMHKKLLDTSTNRDIEAVEHRHGDREASPELARISALITRPPKQKQSKKKDDEKPGKAVIDHTEEAVKDVKIPKTPIGVVSSLGSIGTPSELVVKTEAIPGASSLKPSPKSDSVKKTKNEPENIQDADGKEVWICPACGRVDDGTPMIGCDSCDAWYHWSCVGIKVAPQDDVDWFCRACISKKQTESDGKKKRKKKKDKDKRDH
ncbi:unnamed protein product [Diamesa tonsa]